MQKEKNNSDEPKEKLKRRNARPGFELGHNYSLRKCSCKAHLRTKFCAPILSRKPLPKTPKEAFDMLSTDEKLKGNDSQMNAFSKCTLAMLIPWNANDNNELEIEFEFSSAGLLSILQS